MSRAKRKKDSLDQSLPTDSRPGFFKVDSHDNLEILPPAILDLLSQLLSVFTSLFRVMNGARSDNDE